MDVDRIYNEDCLETMSRMPDDFIDLTVTSPPYDDLRTYKGYSFDFEAVARGLYRVTKPGGVVVWVVNDSTVKGSETGTSFRQALFFKEIGFNLHDTMIYKKKNFIPLSHNRYESCFEYMFVLSRGAPNTFNAIRIKSAKIKGGAVFWEKDGSQRGANSEIGRQDTKVKSNIWEYPTGQGRTGHPAVFPESLALDHINSWSNPGDLIYDPFMGSGTTAKVASLNDREYIGSEISSIYCDIAECRLIDTLL